jgi:hypothetical protein
MPDIADTSVLDKELGNSVSLGGGLFCGQNDEGFAINGVTYKWPRGSKLTWGLAFTSVGGLSAADCKDAITEALKEISSCCDIRHEYVANANGANIKIISQRLDGPSGVLADMQIPFTNAHPDSTQLTGRIDDSERYVLADNPPNGTIDFYRMILHELEHAHGLGHKPASIQSPALIAPIYSLAIRHLQKADIDELVRRYDTPQQAPQPPASGAKPVNYKGIQEISQDGKIWRGEVSGVLQRVQ